MALLDEFRSTVARLSDGVGPSVVGVSNGWAVGSGIVIGEGRILTNAHNLRGSKVRLTFGDGRAVDAEPAGVDVDGDVAVLSADTGAAKALEWRDGDVPTGEPVFALSNPGGTGLRITFGLVSGTARAFRGPRGRRVAGAIEHTAPLVRGSSGGPVVDATGKLVGINTNRLGEGFYLAVPADAALRERVDALGRGESPSRARLGIGIAPPFVARRLRRAVGLPERDGLLVREVESDSPAATAGLERGDLIVGASGRDVATVDDLYEAMDGLPPGASIDLRVVRGTDERTVTVALAQTGDTA